MGETCRPAIACCDTSEQLPNNFAPHVSVQQCYYSTQLREQVRPGVLVWCSQIKILGGEWGLPCCKINSRIIVSLEFEALQVVTSIYSMLTTCFCITHFTACSVFLESKKIKLRYEIKVKNKRNSCLYLHRQLILCKHQLHSRVNNKA